MTDADAVPLLPLLRRWAMVAPDGSTYDEHGPACPDHPRDRLRPGLLMRYVGTCGCTWRETLLSGTDEWPMPTVVLVPLGAAELCYDAYFCADWGYTQGVNELREYPWYSADMGQPLMEPTTFNEGRWVLRTWERGVALIDVAGSQGYVFTRG